jgi:drug/metabolite transporter superfamily protein YnfA
MTSQKTITLVLIFLGLIALVLIVGAFALLLDNRNVPEVVWTLIGTTVGALASMLVSVRANDPAPPVQAPVAK